MSEKGSVLSLQQERGRERERGREGEGERENESLWSLRRQKVFDLKGITPAHPTQGHGKSFDKVRGVHREMIGLIRSD